MLKDTVTVIAGGAGLIGRQFVRAVVKNHGTVILADIDIARAQAETSAIGSSLVEPAAIDITSKESINDLIDKISKKFGKIDAFVNTTYPKGRNYGRAFFEVEYDDFCQTISLNMGGYFLASQQFAAYFKKMNKGNIINVTSIYGVIAPRFDIYNDTKITMPPEYAVIKSGLIHLTKYMAAYLKGSGVRFNCVCPGGVLDGQSEIFQRQYKEYCSSKGMIDPEDLQGTLIYLLSDMSRYVNGQNILVDDGFCL